MGAIVADFVDEVEEMTDECVEHCDAIPTRPRSTSEIIELFLILLLEIKVATIIGDPFGYFQNNRYLSVTLLTKNQFVMQLS